MSGGFGGLGSLGLEFRRSDWMDPLEEDWRSFPEEEGGFELRELREGKTGSAFGSWTVPLGVVTA